MIRKILGIGLSLAAACALAQSPSPTPALSFEAASVKPAAAQEGQRIRVMMGGDPGRVNYSNVSLREIIRVAYGLKDYQISGPDWINSQRFDVVAKMPEGSKEADKPAMLQTLLAERFKMTAHRETKDLPAFAIVVAKGGVKMKEYVAPPDDGSGNRGGVEMPPPPKIGPDGTMKMPAGGRAGMMMMGMGRLQASGIPVSQLADMLTRQLNRPVLDETGLTKKYDIALQWTPETGEGMQGMMMLGPPPGGGGGPEGRPEADTTAPPLPVALQQQLGLRLEPKKLPLELLVVDHLEKAPTDN